ncbi:MAG: transposase [Gallionella sp.]|nr:transposase [Gallionella sp.]
MKRKETGSAGVSPKKEKRPQDWTPEQQLIALHQTHGLSGEALQTWCRENGLFAHHLTSWKAAFCAHADTKTAPGTREIRVLKDENDQLKRELIRKERALAEAAALLILQKKFRALWEDEVK